MYDLAEDVIQANIAKVINLVTIKHGRIFVRGQSSLFV